MLSSHFVRAPRRRLIAGITLAAVVAAQLAVTPAQAATQVGLGITFTAKLPLVHENLPVYRLAPAAAPTGLVQSVLAALKSAPLAMLKTQYVSRNAHGVVAAYVDPVRGDAEVFPDFTAAPQSSIASRATLETAATTVFARADMIPKDATTTRLGTQTPVFASAQVRAGGNASAPQKLFTYVNAMRYAHGLPVFGKGSQATVAIANDGSIRGLVRRWLAAAPAGAVTPTTTAAQLVAAITDQLRALQKENARITVDSIAPAYYDGGAKYLQPVYAFVATVRGGRVSDDHVVGYVPVGKLLEPIPVIGSALGVAPTQGIAAHAGFHDTNGSSITLGQYANDDGAMLDMADAYNNGYNAAPPWWAPAIARTQWYWAYPGDYVGSSANWYANAVNVAYTQPHGDWWLNTTNGRGDGFFYINDIGTNGNPGYGAAAGGSLATWIIDSCEVIPSYYDLQVTTGDGNNAFTPWWPVFQGLHRALGFRTQMLLGMDSMNYQIAVDQASGADVVSAFFTDVAAVNFGTYFNAHLGWNVHWDRASAMIDTRNGGESIYSVQGQSAAGQLSNVWMGD